MTGMTHELSEHIVDMLLYTVGIILCNFPRNARKQHCVSHMQADQSESNRTLYAAPFLQMSVVIYTGRTFSRIVPLYVPKQNTITTGYHSLASGSYQHLQLYPAPKKKMVVDSGRKILRWQEGADFPSKSSPKLFSLLALSTLCNAHKKASIKSSPFFEVRKKPQGQLLPYPSRVLAPYRTVHSYVSEDACSLCISYEGNLADSFP